MKKGLLFVSVAVCILATLCACGNKSKNTQEMPEEEYGTGAVVIKDGCEVSNDGVCVFKQDGLFGIKNACGEVILAPEYAHVVHYEASEVCDEEYAFWRAENLPTTGNIPDAELFCERLNLLLRKDTLNGIFSKSGEELLPLKYPEIYAMSAAGSYAVMLNDEQLSVWKDGRFILNGCESGFYGTDLEKKQYVFADQAGKCWDFYDFNGKKHQRLVMKNAPQGMYLPQFLELGRFLVDDCIVNACGKKLVELPEGTEICGNFLMAPREDGGYNIFFNNGKKMAVGIDMAYMPVTGEIPHLPTGDIVIEKDGHFKLYDRWGKFVKDVPGIARLWVFSEMTTEELDGNVPVYSDYE